jgi:hypothetical protein
LEDGENMNSEQYVITGSLTKETIFNLLYNINTQSFFWRGFTNRKTGMLPSVALYGVCNGQTGIGTYEKCTEIQPVFIMGELERIGRYINNKNKLGEYPFEIPDELFDMIFPYSQGESQFLKNLKERFKMDYYPKNNLLLQAASYVQHHESGTLLLDFSLNPVKALYFAIGKEDINSDSWLFGMPINIFQIYKNTLSGNEKYKFDLYLPSYYQNIRIRNQEGIFVYHLFDMNSICNRESIEYQDILNLFENKFKDIKKMKLQDIEEKSKNSNFNGVPGSIGIFYILLKIPKEEKPYLKHYLNAIGINDDFMMGRQQKMVVPE